MNAFTGLEVEGIFRRSASAVMLRKVQGQFNEGQRVDFATIGDIHIPAAILKSFLRQLPEPILTYDLYDHIIHVQCKHTITRFLLLIILLPLMRVKFECFRIF